MKESFGGVRGSRLMIHLRRIMARLSHEWAKFWGPGHMDQFMRTRSYGSMPLR
jgi:hypothetical protein